MTAKEDKRPADLSAFIMQEVRENPDWNDIMDVAIIRPVQSSPLHPNWDAAFTMDGPRVAPERAFRFVRELQAKFNCAWLSLPQTQNG
jgi:hypothetical protein